MSRAECGGELNIPRDSTTDISTSVTVAIVTRPALTSSLLSQPEVRLLLYDDVCKKYFRPDFEETTVLQTLSDTDLKSMCSARLLFVHSSSSAAGAIIVFGVL